MIEEEKINFLVVGAQKSGTSALDKYLREHSEIEMAPVKEVHYFDNEDNFKDTANYEAYHKNFTSGHSRIKGECTPIYMYWHPSIKRIFEYNPKIKIIVILRNPIERAYSHWNMERDRKADTVNFTTAIKQEAIRCREALPFQHRIFSYTDRGFYSKQIRHIWRFFSKEQTLFIKHDDLKNEPHQVLEELSNFLGISEFSKVKEKDVYSRPYIGKLSDDDYQYLSDLYFNEIKEIETILNWDCSDWKST
ncbi:MAG: hypothetical protein ACI9YH_003899 [Colwellia sp.]|jgi:hypothetical protein